MQNRPESGYTFNCYPHANNLLPTQRSRLFIPSERPRPEAVSRPRWLCPSKCKPQVPNLSASGNLRGLLPAGLVIQAKINEATIRDSPATFSIFRYNGYTLFRRTLCDRNQVHPFRPLLCRKADGPFIFWPACIRYTLIGLSFFSLPRCFESNNQ